VDYSGGRPSIAARVQEFYGSTATPQVGGRPLVLELLSPANRPVQITDDLAGFWQGSWSEVRKEMAGRYPKHDWPQDPADARPKKSGR
jgi:ATP-dependent helicase HrpB